MSMLQVLKKYSWLDSCTGLEIHILPDNSLSIRACSISLDKQELSIEKKFEVSDIRDLLQKLPEKQALALTITGKGVLIKKTADKQDYHAGMLNNIFPDLKAEQFYVQHFVGAKASWTAIIRKDIVDNLIKKIADSGMKVLFVSLGPFAVAPVLKQLNSYGNEVLFDGHSIHYSQAKEWGDYSYLPEKKADFQLKIGIEPIAQQYLLAYATAFQLALHDVLPASGLIDHPAEQSLSEFKEEKKFKFRGMVFLIALFLLLMVNFFVLEYYSSKNDQLLSRVNRSVAGAEQVQEKENSIKQNELLLKDLGWNKGISFAWLADQIGQTVPSTVTLTELSINPRLEGTLRQEENYQTGLIRIKGETTELNQVNNWIYELEKKDWVKQLEMKHFSVADEEGKQQFTLTINY